MPYIALWEEIIFAHKHVINDLSTCIEQFYPQKRYHMLIRIWILYNRCCGQQENTEKMQVLLDLAGIFVIIEKDVFQNRGGGFYA